MANVTTFPLLGFDAEQWMKRAKRKFAFNWEIIYKAAMIFIGKRTSVELEAPVLARSSSL